LENRLLLLLGDMNTERSFTNDWKRVEETVSLVAKQQRVRARDIATRSDVGPILAPKAPIVAPSKSRINKEVSEDTLEDLIKGFKELKVELTTLKKKPGAKHFTTNRRIKRICDEMHMV
jgi:hypothetical protein